MQTFYVVHISPSDFYSVDVFSSKGVGPIWGRMYNGISSASKNRLRALWRKNNRSVYVFKGLFSPARLRAIVASRKGREAALASSLDYLQTSGRWA